jgi:membrane fusion protein, multidrug efflux system
MRTINKLWCLLAMVYMSACATQKDSIPSDSLQPQLFPVITVLQQNINVPLEYVASLQAYQNVEIRARVEGYLEKILVDEGQRVSKGQLLFQINSEEYRAELNRASANVTSAEAEAKAARVELERIRLLVDKNVVTSTDLDLANAKVEVAVSRISQAKAEEALASIKVANTSIRSPFDGVIDRIPFKIGSLIEEGTLFTTISDVTSIYAYFNISEFEYLNFFSDLQNEVSFRNNVELILADHSPYPVKGRLETMENQFEAGTGAIGIRASFKNPEGLIKHGSSGKIRLTESKGSVLLVPQKSTLEIQDKNYVYVVDQSNMVMMKSFTPIGRYGDFYIVGDGLSHSDRFIYEGIQNVREGMVITPDLVASPQVSFMSIVANN